MNENTCQLSFFGHSHVEGNWIIQKDTYRRNKGVKLGELDGITGIGLPCTVRGRNNPGISTYDSNTGIIESHPLYPRLRRWLTY
jgi:hypothetical protein